MKAKATWFETGEFLENILAIPYILQDIVAEDDLKAGIFKTCQLVQTSDQLLVGMVLGSKATISH